MASNEVVDASGGGLASALLEGLTTPEVLAAAMVAVVAVALTWALGSMPPERLVTDPWLRAAWIALIVAMVRPVTWLPYAAGFFVLDLLGRNASSRVRSALGTLGGVLAMTGTAALVFGLVPGALRWVRSMAAFATGVIGFDELGTSAGRLDSGKIAWLVAALVVIRPFLPPLGPDLRPFPNPVLWFGDSRRGTVDRYLLLLAPAGSVLVGVGAWLIAR